MSRKRRRRQEAAQKSSPQRSYGLFVVLGLLAAASFVGWRMARGPDAQHLFELAHEAYGTDPARAESLARQAIEAEGGHFANAELLLCCALAKRNAWRQVETTLARIELAEGSSELLLELGRTALGLDTQGANAPGANAIVYNSLANNHTETALTVLQQARERSGPEQVEALSLLAWLFQATGRVGEMVSVLEELTLVSPDDGRWWIKLGRTCDGLGDPRAVRIYRDAIKRQLTPEHSLLVRYKLIERLIFLGAAADARSELEHLESFLNTAARSRISSEQARIDVYRARLLRLEGRPAEAIQVLDRTLGEFGDVAELIRLRGMLLLDIGDLMDAAIQLERAASLMPHDEIVHFKLAEAYRRQGEAELAARHRQEYERVHKAGLEIIALQTRAANGKLAGADRERLAELYRELGNDEK
ncbi:MAG: hypothetical protein CMJ64_29055 [Planctomycetaceae bacterium]|nr:hypothetical protein [Planctomycetaceae bacterium]